jgi:transposase-like protein
MPAPKPERNAAIVAAYRQPGASLKSVAAQFGVTWMRVRQILHRAGEPRRLANRRTTERVTMGTETSLATRGNHTREHMAKMTANGTPVRTFTEAEAQWAREHWATQTVVAMMAHLQCSARTLKREAHRLGLKPRREKVPLKASDFRAKRNHNKRDHQGFKNRSERYRDADGERESAPPAGTLYACPAPHCGFRCSSPAGHPQCQPYIAAKVA